MFCPYTIPKKFIKDVQMDGGDYWGAMLALFVIFLIFRVATYLVMLYKLKHK